jgi:RNA polymerase sigma-70 factor (ECF subfamily)
VFGYNYSAISNIVGKSPANCRQIMRRVRQRLPHAIPETFRPQQQIKVEQFLDAWTTGNLEQLIALMADDIAYVSDGGGKASATHKPLYGQQKVARFLIAIRCSPQLRQISHFTSRLGTINDQPSIINYANGIPHSVMTFDWSQHSREAF